MSMQYYSNISLAQCVASKYRAIRKRFYLEGEIDDGPLVLPNWCNTSQPSSNVRKAACCGVVRFGVVWCGAIWSGVVWCGVVRMTHYLVCVTAEAYLFILFEKPSLADRSI